MFVSIVIASKGRPDVLEATLDSVFRQSILANEVIICVPCKSDVTERILSDPRVKLIIGPLGASVQRNVAMDAVSESSNLIVFLDDDVELAEDYIMKVVNFMFVSSDVVAISGTPASDIAKDGLLSRHEALEILKTTSNKTVDPKDRESLYGCNMAVRAKPAKSEKFDERLKEYSYLEDVDFGSRLTKYGRLVDYAGEKIVHFGTPGGRISEEKMGYVQIMNPLYLFFVKGTLSKKQFRYLFFRVLLGNLIGATGALKFVRRNDKLDRSRRKRIIGNFIALRHVIFNGIQPESVAKYTFKR